jgi:hypothetical protein
MSRGDKATVSVTVAVAQVTAFEVFTREIDLWWRRGPRFRFGRQPGQLSFEPGLGGRLFESFTSDSGVHVREVGRVTVWEPPSRLMFNWRNANFSDDECTEVEVLFEPTESGTRVTVQHRGWAALRADHPARHGLQGADFSRMMGLWWGDLMTGLREFLEAKT